MFSELRKFIAPEFIFGLNSRLLLGQYLSNFGAEKALIVTDKNLVELKWFKDILQHLDQVDQDYVVFNDVTPNPRDYEVTKGCQIYLEEACDILVAIGGGSVIDCTKGIGVLVENGGNIRDYEGVDEIPLPLPLLVSIPTTSGSAADVSQFAIISHTDKDYKMVLASKILVPDLALIDPLVTLTCDRDLTIDTSLDALVHATEAYVSNASSFMTDLHALKAIELIIKYLPSAAKNLDDVALRSIIMEACLHAGMAFSNASLGLVHAMAHALGGKYDLTHGEINGILLEHVVACNYNYAKDKYDDINVFFGGQKPLKDNIHEFIEKIRVNRHLHEMHEGTMDFETMAEYVLKDPCIVTNPREMTKEDVVSIYERVF